MGERLNNVLVVFRRDVAVGLTLGNQPAEMQLPLYVWSLSLLAYLVDRCLARSA